MVVAAAGADAALAFIELGAVAVVLSVLARLAGRIGITAIPLYLLAGLAVGSGGIAPLDVSSDFISLAADIGVLLLLLMLGLEYSADELTSGLRRGWATGAVDAVTGFAPGFGAALLLGWSFEAAVVLGGVTWVTSSGVVAKILADAPAVVGEHRGAVLNLLVIEDLAMAVYLPVIGALVAGRSGSETAVTVAIALAAVGLVLALAIRFGQRLSAALLAGSDEALLLAVFGLTLLVGGLAEQVEVSAAIGAFVVGVALSGPVRARVGALIGPLRDLFAATFFLFFSFEIRPADLVGSLAPAAALLVVAGGAKLLTGWWATRSWRPGTVLIARGEFSIVIASLAAPLHDGADLGALAAAFVLLSAIAGPLAAKRASNSLAA
jgi:CPA2 family monovalent cation:H+ antiporter-2